MQIIPVFQSWVFLPLGTHEKPNSQKVIQSRQFVETYIIAMELFISARKAWKLLSTFYWLNKEMLKGMCNNIPLSIIVNILIITG
jgi:hypothetical protein